VKGHQRQLHHEEQVLDTNHQKIEAFDLLLEKFDQRKRSVKGIYTLFPFRELPN
jgi:hypothetical protein